MSRAIIAIRLFAIAAALPLSAFAQDLSAEAFAKHYEVNEVALSPTGAYAALAVPSDDGMETQLQILKLDGSGQTQVLRFGRRQHVANVVWTSDDRLVVSRARMLPLRPQPVSQGELLSSDISGKDQELLFGYVKDSGNLTGRRKDQGFAKIVDTIDAEPGIAIVDFTCWDCGERPDTVLFKVNTRTGERHEIERVADSPTLLTDLSGKARFAVFQDDNENIRVRYRPQPNGEWLDAPKTLVGRSIDLAAFSEDGKTAYALIDDEGGPVHLYKIDMSTGTRVLLAGRDDVEITGLLYAGHNGLPFGVVYNAGKPSVQYLDPTSEWSKLHAGFLKMFPGQLVRFSGFSQDSNRMLVTVYSDRNPGAYYVYDRAAKKLDLISELAPALKVSQLASSTPIEFSARDGQKLYGLYTAKGPGMHPLVVMPHGGPHGPYDSWSYDADAQFLASRGYGVLQVNYRGSGGRGYNFQKAGYREWGGRIMDDITDGVRWAISQKLADPERICTYGASFGGYAALMQPIRNPGMYKCAIGYVGVYDLQTMYSAGDIKRSSNGRAYLDRVLGKDKTVLAANSPAQNPGKIGVPVFLIQGGVDQRVPMAQFNALKSSIGAANVPVETMVGQGEGHGFVKFENRVELYKRMDAFLAKYIGPGAN